MSQQSKVQSRGNVPFSWENKPGVSKVTQKNCLTEENLVLKLPSPPCPSKAAETRISVQDDLQIPLPPCTFQKLALSKSCSSKGLRKHEDPFLAAYKECTKSTKIDKRNHKFDMIRSRLKRLFDISCKSQRASTVRDDSLLKLSHQTNSPHQYSTY